MRAATMKERPSFPLMRQTDVQTIYHMQMPRWLFSDPRYADMSLDAKVTYTFLLNRFQLSRRNGWVNELARCSLSFHARNWQRSCLTPMWNGFTPNRPPGALPSPGCCWTKASRRWTSVCNASAKTYTAPANCWEMRSCGNWWQSGYNYTERLAEHAYLC